MDPIHPAEDTGLPRRTVLRVGGVAAWAAPVIVLAAPAQAVSTSGPTSVTVTPGTTSARPDGGGRYDLEIAGLRITTGAAVAAGTLTLTVTYVPDVDGLETDLIAKYAANPPGWAGPTPGQASSGSTLTYTFAGSVAAGGTVPFPDGHFFGTSRSAGAAGGEGVFSLTFSADGQTSATVAFTTPGHREPGALRIDNQDTTRGAQLVVPIRVDAAGNEAGYRFSFSYDQSRLSSPQVVDGNAGGTVAVDASTPGRVGVTVSGFSGGTITRAINAILVHVTFTVVSDATLGTTPITFTDTPTARTVSGVDGNALAAQPTYSGGSIRVVTPSRPALRVDNGSGSRGSSISVPVRVDTVGTEATYRFSISYDQAQLTNPQISIGNSGGAVVSNAGTPGRIAVSVSGFSGGAIASGTNKILATVTFAVALDSSADPLNGVRVTQIAFTDTPISRKVSRTDGADLATQPTYGIGSISIF